MSSSEAHSHDHGHGHGHDHGHSGHTPAYYVKTWALLVVLLIASVVGPMLGHPIITLITAFGIAVVKAYLVATRFMHLNIEPKFVTYFVVSCLAFMFLMFFGVAPDVLKHDGRRWENVAAKQAAAKAAAAHGAHGGAAGSGAEHHAP